MKIRTNLSTQRNRSKTASRRTFLAQLETLEPRHLLAPITPTPWGSSAVSVDDPCQCGGTNTSSSVSVAASSGAAVASLPSLPGSRGFVPEHSTISFRPIVQAVDLQFNNPPPTTVEVNGVFYDSSGSAPGQPYRVGDLLDPTSLSAGRYPFTLHITEHFTSSSTPNDGSGFSLVAGPSNVLMSPGWHIPGIDRLTVSTGGALWQTGGDTLIWFTESSGSYLRPDGDQDVSNLVDNLDGTFTLTNRWGDSQTFNALGYVSEKVDRDGRTTTFTYIDADSDSDADDISEIESYDGRILTYSYDSNRISSITDFDGREITFSYNVNDQLETITYPDPDDGGPQGPFVVTYTYKSSTDYIEGIDDNGNTTTITYDFAGAVDTITDPEGKVKDYQAYLIKPLHDPTNGKGTSKSPETLWKAADVQGMVENEDGDDTTYIMGPLGLPLKMIDALGNETTYVRNSDGRVTQETGPDPDGAEPAPVTSYEYTGGNLTKMTLPDGSIRTWTYDAKWNIPDSYTDERGLETQYDIEYATGWNLETRQVIGEVDDEYNLEEDDIVVSFTYTEAPVDPEDPPAGLVATETDPLGKVTVYEYNARGQVTSTTYADGTADEATRKSYYNADGTLDYETDELTRRTDYTYDLLGRLILKTLADPDDGGPLSRPEIAYEHDVWNRLIKETDPLGRETAYTYDKRGLQTKIERPDHDGDTELTTTTTVYDDRGLVNTVTDPLGRVTTYSHDKLGRQDFVTLPAVADPSTAVNEVQIIDFDSGTEGTFKLNGNSKHGTIDLADPSDFQTVLDSIWGTGHTRVKVTATEATVTFKGDLSATNVAQMTISDITGTKGATPFVSTDTAGVAASMVNPVTETHYDALGRVDYTVDARGAKTTYNWEYLNPGQRLTITLPDPDPIGSGPGKDPPVLYQEFDASGNLLKETDANGNETVRQYDILGRLTKLIQADPGNGAPVTEYQYDLAGNLRYVTDQLGNTTEYQYDGRYRQVKVISADPDGSAGPLTSPVTEYVYDAAGQLLSVAEGVLTNEIQSLYFGSAESPTNAAGAGSFALMFGGYTTALIGYDHYVVPGYVESVFEDLSSVGDGNIVVTQSPWQPNYSWEFVGGLGSADQPIPTVVSNTVGVYAGTIDIQVTQPGISGTQPHIFTITLTDSPTAGKFALNMDAGGDTAELDWDASDSEVEAAITAVYPGWSVTGSPGGPWTVQSTSNIDAPTWVGVGGSDPLRQPLAIEIVTVQAGSARRTTAYEYDGLGRTVKVSLPDPDGPGVGASLTSSVTEYAYDAAGQIVSVTDPQGNVTEYEYDVLGNRTLVIERDPDGSGGPLTSSLIRYVHDSAGQLLSVTEGLLANEIQALYFGSAGSPQNAGTGYFELAFGGYTVGIGYDQYVVPGWVESALEGLASIGAGNISVTDSGSPPNYVWEFIGDLAGANHPIPTVVANRIGYNAGTIDIQVVQAGIMGTQPHIFTIALSDSPSAGKFALNMDAGSDTVDINWNAEASEVEAAITGTYSGWTVSGPAGGPWAVESTANIDAPNWVGVNGGSVDWDPLRQPLEIEIVTVQAGSAGRKATYEYDGLGRTVKITQLDPDGIGNAIAPVTHYSYDLNGNQVQVRDPLQLETNYVYDFLNRRVSSTDSLGGFTEFTYDDNGNLKTLTDPKENTTEWFYDELNRVEEEENELGASRFFYYDAAGNLVRKVDRNERETVYEYDNRHRLVAEEWWTGTRPNIEVSTSTDGSRADEVQRVGFYSANILASGTFTVTYGGQTTGTIAFDADAATVEAALEALSNIANGDVIVTTAVDTDYEQLWEITFVEGLASTDVVQVTINASSVYDGSGAPAETETTITEGYTTNEVQVVALNDTSGGTFRLSFGGAWSSAVAWDASTGDVDSALEALSGAGTVSVSGSAGGPYTITFTGDYAGLNIAPLYPRANDLTNTDLTRIIAYSFNQDGDLEEVSDPDATYEYEYDGVGRVTNYVQNINGLNPEMAFVSSYNAASSRTELQAWLASTKDFRNTYTYDAMQRLTALVQQTASGGNVVAPKRIEFNYNEINQFTSVNRYASINTSEFVAASYYTYDDMNRLTKLVHMQSTSAPTSGWGDWPLAGYEYDYDAGSRILAIDSYMDGLSEYEHDDTYQLLAADHASMTDEGYEYDANGNRIMSGYNITANNQLQSDGTYTYEYDFEGNRKTRTRISDGYVTRYEWDHRNRLTKVIEEDDNDNVLQVTEHYYDAYNQWIRRRFDDDGDGGNPFTETFFVYEAGQVVYEFDGDDDSDLSHRYAWGILVDQAIADEQVSSLGSAGQVLWTFGDHLGTIRDLVTYNSTTDEATVANHREWDSYGNLTDQSSVVYVSTIGYTGRMWDITTGLQNNLNRWYDAGVGRWTSEDPIQFRGMDSNLARYVSNGVLTYVDPVGQSADALQSLAAALPGIEATWNSDVALFTARQDAQQNLETLIDAVRPSDAIAVLDRHFATRGRIADFDTYNRFRVGVRAVVLESLKSMYVIAVETACILVPDSNGEVNRLAERLRSSFQEKFNQSIGRRFASQTLRAIAYDILNIKDIPSVIKLATAIRGEVLANAESSKPYEVQAILSLAYSGEISDFQLGLTAR